MENINKQSKVEQIQKYLQEKERYEKELLVNFQNEDTRLRDEYRCNNISYEEYLENRKKYYENIKISEEHYKAFMRTLFSNNLEKE